MGTPLFRWANIFPLLFSSFLSFFLYITLLVVVSLSSPTDGIYSNTINFHPFGGGPKQAH